MAKSACEYLQGAGGVIVSERMSNSRCSHVGAAQSNRCSGVMYEGCLDLTRCGWGSDRLGLTFTALKAAHFLRIPVEGELEGPLRAYPHAT